MVRFGDLFLFWLPAFGHDAQLMAGFAIIRMILSFWFSLLFVFSFLFSESVVKFNSTFVANIRFQLIKYMITLFN